jgi:hypothetical protein
MLIVSSHTGFFEKGKVHHITCCDGTARGRKFGRYNSTLSLNWALNGGGCLTLYLYPRHFPGTHSRTLGGPQGRYWGCGKFRLYRVSIPGPSSPLRVAMQTTVFFNCCLSWVLSVLSTRSLQATCFQRDSLRKCLPDWAETAEGS